MTAASTPLSPRRSRPRVLITDGDSRTALACVRSLVAAGHEPWVIGPGRRTLAGVSRGARSEVVTASPLEQPAAYAAAIARIVRQRRIDVLLPVSDGAVEALLPNRHLLPPDVRLPMPTHDAFRAATDKAGTLERARRAGFAVPESREVASAAALEAALDGMRYPAILKPHRSVVTDEAGRRRKLDVEFVPDEAALRAVVAALPPAAFPVMLQERIRGAGEGIFALRWDGRMVATFAHRRLREKPPAGGISVLRESIAPPPALAAAAEALLADLDWQGVAMIECKRDERTGAHHFIEVNGRLWGSLQLAIDAGIDFPALLVACALDEPVMRPPRYEVGVRTRWFWGDVDHLYARMRRPAHRLHLDAPYPSRWQVLREFVTDGFTSLAEIERASDPAPALLEWSRRLVPSLPSRRSRPAHPSRPAAARAPSPA